jgi:hypothetical protein
MADIYELLPHHLDQLHQGSGLSLDIIQERGYRSLQGTEGYKVLKDLGFSKLQCKLTPGLLLPVWSPDPAVRPALYVYRSDNPRLDERDGRPRKYEFPKGQGMRLDCPPRCRALLQDPTIGLWVTEGQKKADALADRGMCVIDLLGVWNFKGRNAFRGTTILADWDYVALKDRHVTLVFDSDVMLVPAVRQALNRLTEHLQRKGAQVVAVYLPQENGHKVGVDDFLLTHTLADLDGLIEHPRPQPQAAPPIIELLGEAPKILHRPLMSIDGHSYAATWLWTKTTQTEKVGKDGEVVRLQEPKITQEQRLFVMRDDGVLFGEVSDPKVQPLTELLITIHLPDHPRDDLLWRAYGVAAYRQGYRPEPKEVFGRVVQVYNHFLDFHRSVDAQPTMCRLSACQSLMTWFADAFTVLPYPWPNSPAPGSGKTKWGHCWTKTSYLGYLTSASGSFAALRDLADMGATILFDDAEGLADPKADPDKQALILAGNRKGVSIPVKEAGPDGRWHTRWLNAYCPRGFTALRLPFPALQSRSIVVPLVASADAERANRDPENPDDWPVDQRALRDDLWAFALFLQSKAATIWTELSKETSMFGRD